MAKHHITFLFPLYN